MEIRIGDEVFRGGKLIGIRMKGAWYRYQGGETGKRNLIPLEPHLSSADARDVAACDLARPPAKPPRDPIADRIAWIDAFLGPRAMKWERAQ